MSAHKAQTLIEPESLGILFIDVGGQKPVLSTRPFDQLFTNPLPSRVRIGEQCVEVLLGQQHEPYRPLSGIERQD